MRNCFISMRIRKNIHHVLDDKLAKVQEAMERELAAITLADVKRDIALDIEEQCNH